MEVGEVRKNEWRGNVGLPEVEKVEWVEIMIGEVVELCGRKKGEVVEVEKMWEGRRGSDRE